MTTAATQRKNALRKRRELDAFDRRERSAAVCKNLLASREFFAAGRVACYLPMQDEVDVRNVIERGWRAKKRIFVPVLRNPSKIVFCEVRPDTTLQRNLFGIWEPIDSEQIHPRHLQLVIAPLAAFDNSLHRIGMGGGFYDRCFAFLRHRTRWLQPKLVGVAFDCQKVEKISPNPWDIRLYRVFTESR